MGFLLFLNLRENESKESENIIQNIDLKQRK